MFYVFFNQIIDDELIAGMKHPNNHIPISDCISWLSWIVEIKTIRQYIRYNKVPPSIKVTQENSRFRINLKLFIQNYMQFPSPEMFM